MTSLFASENRSKLRVVPDLLLKALKAILSVPKKLCSACTNALVAQQWPEGGWSGKGGVTSGGPLKTGVVGWNSGGHHVGSATVAAIGCWNDKYYWQFWRPITAIREADTDGNPGAG